MTLTRQQLAGGLIVGLGAIAAIKIVQDAPEMSNEDVAQAKKAALGMGSFAVVLYLACKQLKWGFCKDIGAG
ncbi:MAG: hypothetical protein WC683_02210 [bacterium]